MRVKLVGKIEGQGGGMTGEGCLSKDEWSGCPVQSWGMFQLAENFLILWGSCNGKEQKQK